MTICNRLYTIPFSHFCEKARWGLDYCGIPFLEIKRLPLFHLPTLARLLLRQPSASADRVSSRFSTPALATIEGKVISDSSDILQYCAQTPKGAHLFSDASVSPIVQRLGEQLAPHSRRIAYFHLLPKPRLTQSMVNKNVGPWQANSYKILRPLASMALRKTFDINPRSAERSLAKAKQEFDWIASTLSHRQFLVGHRFSAADLTFAALASPLLLVTFEEGFGAHFPSVDQVPSEYRDTVMFFRNHPAGRHALSMYRNHRKTKSDKTL